MKITTMHKRNFHRNTDSMRIARATQVRLDEISERIERDKHRSIKSNNFEKMKVWNELKSIHRVFEPLYVLKEGQEKLAKDQGAHNKDSNGESNNAQKMKDKSDGQRTKVAEQQTLSRRAEIQSGTEMSRRRSEATEARAPSFGKRMSLSHISKRSASPEKPEIMRSRSCSWSHSSSPRNDPYRLLKRAEIQNGTPETRRKNSDARVALLEKRTSFSGAFQTRKSSSEKPDFTRTRAEIQNWTQEPRRKHSDAKVQVSTEKRTSFSRAFQTRQASSEKIKPEFTRARSYTWSGSPSPSLSARNEPHPSAETSDREHLAKLRQAAEKPSVSLPMSTVTNGYLAFKRVLRNKRQSAGMERQFVTTRFRSMSLDDEELSTNSRLLVPGQSEAAQKDEMKERAQMLEAVTSIATSAAPTEQEHKDKNVINRRLSTVVGNTLLRSSLSWPASELPKRPSLHRRKALLTPDLLRKNPEALRAAAVAQTKNVKRVKRSKSSGASNGDLSVWGSAAGANIRERSSESDNNDEELFGTFDENPKETSYVLKGKFKRTGSRRKSNYLKPLGTGCFSESFQSKNE